MPNTRVRVVGSGFTTFNYQGRPIAFLDRVRDSGQQAVSDRGQGWEAITPIGAMYPVEIATSRVLGPGTLELSIRELWNEPIWYQLVGLAGAPDQVAVFQRLAQTPSFVTCQTIIKPPGGGSRTKTYHNCVVVDIGDGEEITVGALSVQKTITVVYTHATR